MKIKQWIDKWDIEIVAGMFIGFTIYICFI